jgi:hypothetical protein
MDVHSSQVDALYAWLDKHSVVRKYSVAMFPESGRGAMARHPLAPGETIVSSSFKS